MKYALGILKKELRKEKNYKYQHEKCLKDFKGNISDERAFQMSVRIADERIPQLEKAIKILRSK